DIRRRTVIQCAQGSRPIWPIIFRFAVPDALIGQGVPNMRLVRRKASIAFQPGERGRRGLGRNGGNDVDQITHELGRVPRIRIARPGTGWKSCLGKETTCDTSEELKLADGQSERPSVAMSLIPR